MRALIPCAFSVSSSRKLNFPRSGEARGRTKGFLPAVGLLHHASIGTASDSFRAIEGNQFILACAHVGTILVNLLLSEFLMQFMGPIRLRTLFRVVV